MPAIPSALIQRLRDTLARYPALESDRALRAVFIDARLAPWLNRVPEDTANRANRVNALIAVLCDQTNAQGDNALVLFLHALAEQTDFADALHAELRQLAAELAAYPPAELAALKPAVQPPVRLPPFAIITGVIAILLIALIALANLPAARDQLPAVFQPRAFPKEREGETLIVIAAFHRSEGVTDTEPHEKIRRAIEQARDEVGFTTLRVAVEPTRLRADDRTGAQALGDRYDASLIIWGEDTGVEVRVNFYNRKQPDFKAADVRIEEILRTQIAAPSEYAALITQDLPAQVTFLSLFAVGQSYVAAENYPASARAIEAAVARLSDAQSFEGAADAYFRLGWLYQGPLPDPPQALAAYTYTLELDPDHALAYNNRGVTYHDLGEYTLALADFSRALELDPDYTYAYSNRGNIYAITGNYSAAFMDYTRALELDPDLAYTYNNRGNTYADLGEHDLALADYTRALELDPDYAVAYNNRGIIYADIGDHALALADYTRALELDLAYPPAYYNRGRTYHALGEYTLALADYTHALELAPAYALAYNHRGDTYHALFEYDLALADYTRALELAPDDAVAYYNRGFTYAAGLGEHDLALADYTRALELDPNYVKAYNNRGITYQALFEYDLALADYTRALELAPDDAAVYHNRGSTYHDLGEHALALADYTRALELAPDLAAAYFNRGLTYYALGKYTLALADYTHVLKLDPTNASAHYFGARVHAALGDVNAACAWLENALILVPTGRVQARKDEAFDPIRDAPCFQALTNGK